VKGSKAAVALLALAFVVPLLVIVMVVGGVAPPCDQQGAGSSGGGPGTGALAAGGIPVAFVPLIQKAGALDAAFPAPVLAAQIQQESGFHASAVSSTGAMGYSQFEPATWNSYGKDTTGKGSADPNNFSDAVDAQARYDHDLANQVRDAQTAGKIHSTASVTEMALGGYNAGITAVIAAGGVPGNAQTSAYVPAIMNMARGKFSQAGTTVGAAPGAPAPGAAPAAPAAGAGVSASGGCGSPGQVQVLALTYPSTAAHVDADRPEMAAGGGRDGVHRGDGARAAARDERPPICAAAVPRRGTERGDGRGTVRGGVLTCPANKHAHHRPRPGARSRSFVHLLLIQRKDSPCLCCCTPSMR